MNAKGERAAFFDLDGTLLPPPSLERRFISYLLRRGELGFTQAGRWLVRFLTLAAFDFRAATEANKTYLTGLPTSLADDWARWCERQPFPFFAECLQLLEWHAAQGHRIYLISGTLAPLAHGVARQLPVPVEVCATELEACDGCWTGGIRGDLISGAAKESAMKRLAAQDDLDLSRSCAYGDRSADIRMLMSAGYTTAINPSFALERLARQRGWPVLEWRRRARGSATGFPARRAVRGRQ